MVLHVLYLLFMSGLNSTRIFLTDFRKIWNIKCYENPSGGERVVPCGPASWKFTCNFWHYALLQNNQKISILQVTQMQFVGTTLSASPFIFSLLPCLRFPLKGSPFCPCQRPADMHTLRTSASAVWLQPLDQRAPGCRCFELALWANWNLET
jgi:hypothetical protein